jgi:hypothetical protein
MASFTDSISQFNPYVQQLPVDAMVKVGMQKQAQYDQGVQKIQSYIDNIAGLDVMPKHKEYLQSKLNQLGGSLRSVAAGDFSNQQLVNSVGGMTTQIIKDPTVQNAVYSAQKIRKGFAEEEAADKAGKSSIVNKTIYNDLVNKWMSDPDLKKSFNGEYTQYIDVDKKLNDIVEKVTAIDSSTDDPFQRNADGSVAKDAQGKPMLNDAVVRTSVKGKSAAKILANFYSSLNADELNQLQMNGQYHYRGSNVDNLKRDITATFNTQKNVDSAEVIELDLELKTNNSLTDAQKAAIKGRINKINSQIENGYYEKELASRLAMLDDPAKADALKGQVYTQNLLTTKARDAAQLSYKRTLENNPYVAADQFRQRLSFDYASKRQQNEQFWASYGQTEKWKQLEYDQKQTEIDQREASLNPKAVDAAMTTGIEGLTVGTLNQKIKDGDDAITMLNGQYASTIAKNHVGVKAQTKFLNDLYSQYRINPGSITDNNQRKYLQLRDELENNNIGYKQLAMKVANGSTQFNVELDKVLAGAPGVTFANGSSMYSGKELFEVQAAAKELTKYNATLGGYATGKIDVDALVNKFRGTRLAPLAIAIAKSEKGASLTPTEKILLSQSRNVYKSYKGEADNIFKKKSTFESNMINTYLPERQMKIGTINPENKVDQANMAMLMDLKAGQFDQLGSLDSNKPDDYNPATWQELRASKTAQQLVYKNPDGTAMVALIDGDKKQSFPVTAKELAIYFPKIARQHPMDNVKFQIRSSPAGTTNTAGLTDDPGAAVTARYTGYHLPGLKGTKLAPLFRYDIEGGGEDEYQLRAWVNDNGVWKGKVLNQAGYATADGLVRMINNIGPATVQEMLKSK